MAKNKTTTKTDVQEKVARLKKKLKQLAGGLAQQQSRISSLQLQVDDLRRNGGAHAELDTLRESQLTADGRLGDLETDAVRRRQADEDLFARLRDLEGRSSGSPAEQHELARSVAALQDRIGQLPSLQQRLEGLGAELEQLHARQARPDVSPEPDPVTAELGGRVHALEQELRRLSEGQESLELKTELLSREAEDDDESTTPALPDLYDHPHIAQLSQQLQGLEQRLFDLARETGQLASRGTEIDGLRASVEHQLSALDSAQMSGRGRLDEVLSRAEALETAVARQADQANVVSRQVTTVADQLQGLLALGADRRLGEIERALNDERGRLGELGQKTEAAEQRLNSVAGHTEGLAGTVAELRSRTDQAGQEIGRLDTALQNTGHAAQRQEERLQAHDGLLANLDQARQAQQKSTDSLGVQQARQDSANQRLEQSLRSRSTVGLLLLLLLTAGLGYLLWRDRQPAQGPEPLVQSEPARETESTIAVAGLQQEVADLRRQIAGLDDSVSTVVGTVDRLDAQTAPDLPRQMKALNETVRALIQENSLHQQLTGDLKADQDRLQAELDAQQKAFNALLGQFETLEKRLGEPQAAQAPAEAAAAGHWEQARASRAYTLQIAGFYKRESLEWFVRQHRIGDGSAVYETRHQGRPWHVLFYGTYATVAQAVAAARQLPASLAAHQPWVRRIPVGGKLDAL